eukprot:3009304-Alexandrium_andersonii.AAC.1
MGSRVSHAKCALFSTCASTRAAMRNHQWPVLQAHIPVALSARDLGAQINFGKVACTGVLADRFHKATGVVNHVRGIPSAAVVKLRL